MTTTANRDLPATEALIVSLDEYIRARYGLLAVQTFEEERFIRFMRGVAEHERHRAKGLYLWSRTRGLRRVRRPPRSTHCISSAASDVYKRQQLRQMKLQAARERLQEALSPLEEGAQQLHAVVFDAATALRTSLQKNQALRGSSARKARQICRWFQLMNWTGDQQLELLIRELEQLANAPTPRGASAIRNQSTRCSATSSL